jgi:hypothetical protein
MSRDDSGMGKWYGGLLGGGVGGNRFRARGVRVNTMVTC